MRKHAMRRAEAWMLERLNGEDGLGAIFPAMVGFLAARLGLAYAIVVFSGLGFAVMIIALLMLPETKGRVLTADA